MDIKVTGQMIEQALKEIKTEQPQRFAMPKAELYGVSKTMDEAITTSGGAQKKLLFSKISDRQKYMDAVRQTTPKRENLEMILRLFVEETEIGDYEHRLTKNRLAAEKTPGTEDLLTEAMTGDDGLTLVEYCPFGVIRATAPTTNPTETIISNSISTITGGNIVVFDPHPRAKKVSQITVKLLNKALAESGAPENLITMMEEPSMESTNKMIGNPSVRLLVATEGPSVIKKVPSFGKRTIDARAGNPLIMVDETVDIVKAAKDIMGGCSFDNNASCIVEKEVFAVDSIYDYLIHNVKKSGAYQITDSALSEKLVTFVTNEKGGPKIPSVGKSVRYILDELGITMDTNVRVIIMEVPREHLLIQEEMMMPILPMIRVCDVDTAAEYTRRAEHGNRHTTMMHSRNVEKLSKMAKIMGTTIFVRDAPSCTGIGVGEEGYTTFTVAGPTGERLTPPRAFYRKRKCIMTDAFNIH